MLTVHSAEQSSSHRGLHDGDGGADGSEAGRASVEARAAPVLPLDGWVAARGCGRPVHPRLPDSSPPASGTRSA